MSAFIKIYQKVHVPRVQNSQEMFKYPPKETLRSNTFAQDLKVSRKCNNTKFVTQVLLPGLGTGKSPGTDTRAWHSRIGQF